MNTVDLLLHPVRLRVVHALAGGRQLSTTQLCARLPGVSTVTVYRQVGVLLEAGFLEVAAEQRVRGAMERHYRLRQDRPVVDADAAGAMTLQDHRHGFAAAVAVLVSEFSAYLDRKGADPIADGVSYRQATLWLTPDERAAMTSTMLEVLRDSLANQPSPGRRPYLISPILFPAPQTSHEPDHSSMPAALVSLIDDLARSFDAVGVLIAQVHEDLWMAATPCTDWTVRALVNHLIGMNRVLIALLAGMGPPRRPAADHIEPDPVRAYRDTAAELLASFAVPGALERDYQGPLGSATGAERLQIRLYDLLAHGWDLAQATGQPFEPPNNVAERSLSFARTQVGEHARPGRFGPAQATPKGASDIELLAAFLGRPVRTAPASHPLSRESSGR